MRNGETHKRVNKFEAYKKIHVLIGVEGRSVDGVQRGESRRRIVGGH